MRAVLLAIAAALALATAGWAAWLLAHSVSADANAAAARRSGAPADTLAAGSSADSFPRGVERLDSLLEPIRARRRAPALGVAIVRGDRLWALGVVGVRRAGRPEPARWSDRFHIGSDTKSMTATVAALLIEEGRLRWDTTLAELFPELAARMRPEYRRVTVEMLMHHASGLRDDRGDLVFFARQCALRGSDRAQRLAAVGLALARRPACVPGTKCVYANANFNILGAVVERVTGDSWESQLRRRLFEPLGMKTAGFGAPNTPGRLDQPWGHVVVGPWPRRLLWSQRTWLPPVTHPAGNVSLSLPDWARYAALHLEGARGRCRLLSWAAFRRLHEEEPPGSQFAAGWGVAHLDSNGTVLEHAGSDGWWYATIGLFPERDLAILVATNVGGTRGDEACWEALRAARALAGGPGAILPETRRGAPSR